MEKDLAISVARRLGLAFGEGVVIGRGVNVLVHLRPAPVVARVSRLAHLVRSPEALAGSVALAKALGARATPPSWLVDPEHGELEPEMRTALTAYGSYDPAAVEALQPLVVLSIAAWGSLAALGGETSPRTAHRLAWLREH